MPKKQCPNGHIYDPSIYGDQCPLCPQGGAQAPAGGSPKTHVANAPAGAPAPAFDNHTHVAGPAGGFAAAAAADMADPTGKTKCRPQDAGQPDVPAGGGHTVIRRPKAAGAAAKNATGRRLVGFLVTYNNHPDGKAFNLYEGRNSVGRSPECDISLPEDGQMSSHHLTIAYRSAENKFRFKDELSSNGTFINKEIRDDGELQNYDIIRAGGTLFIFIAIPQ